MELRPHTEERLKREWQELYAPEARVQEYGDNHIDDGDYYLVDENFDIICIR